MNFITNKKVFKSFDYDLIRMKKAIDSPRCYIPQGLSREERRKLMNPFTKDNT